jgi:hypothetical protein
MIFLPSPMVARKVSESNPGCFFVGTDGCFIDNYSLAQELLMPMSVEKI